MNKSLNASYCSECGSSDIQIKAWINPNTKTICDTCYESFHGTLGWCNACSQPASISSLSQLWEEFGDIPVNNDDELETDFLHFPAGTSKLDIWHWFDERCPNNLHDDLMFPSNKK